ncbi:GntR family transcriptional regulator [Bailinhaonella thermotolerans]|uniref:GntR family transcriptional regulator n=1 Tax=Bailinhaonella thermotolerans TaxID=1070861 RepID=A0A3A4B2S2_9ACTN|nr:GntR family transcriptional regulator [Bailinhaonella thermotolerans]RJL31690.1 GntR family transcriptional regulator [Bailinhaonella thermotolerans]
MGAQPLWREIAEDLQQQIERGEWRPGALLPPEVELRARYNASRNTVRDALKWLSTRGLVQSRAGRGTFVAETVDPFVVTMTATGPGGGETDPYLEDSRLQGRDSTLTTPRVEIQKADADVAAGLRIGEGELVVLRHQQRMVDGRPCSLHTTFYPHRLVEEGAERLRVADPIREGVSRYLDETLDLRETGFRDRLIARPPNKIESMFFRIPDDGSISMIGVTRVGFDQHGRPLRLIVTVYAADRNHLVYDIGQVPPAT